MPSSISVSNPAFHRRPVPDQPWKRIAALVVLLGSCGIAGWEGFWRARFFVPGDYEDTPAVWEMQRERVKADDTVLIGSSRMWEDVDLTAWQQITGKRPIQLSLAGRNPRPVLSDLAADESFHGLVACEITPYLFFVASEDETTDFMRRARTQTVSQRLSNHVAMMLEGRLAFIDNETRITTLWRRVPFPLRAGNFPVRDVPKGHVMQADRNARMWARVEQDSSYRVLFRGLWLFYAGGPQPSLADKPADDSTAHPHIDAIVAEAARHVAADVTKIRNRGGDVVFVRFPSAGPVYLSEARSFPRALAWEPFLMQTRTAGIHFEDYPQLQGFDLPEWSHMSAHDATPFTHALAPLVTRSSKEHGR